MLKKMFYVNTFSFYNFAITSELDFTVTCLIDGFTLVFFTVVSYNSFIKMQDITSYTLWNISYMWWILYLVFSCFNNNRWLDR